MTDADLYALKQNANLMARTEIEILKNAQYTVNDTAHHPYAVSPDGKTLSGGDGTYSNNYLAFARQAMLNPASFVTAFMGFVVMDAQVQLDEEAVADSFIAGVVLANLANVWK